MSVRHSIFQRRQGKVGSLTASEQGQRRHLQRCVRGGKDGSMIDWRRWLSMASRDGHSGLPSSIAGKREREQPGQSGTRKQGWPVCERSPGEQRQEISCWVSSWQLKVREERGSWPVLKFPLAFRHGVAELMSGHWIYGARQRWLGASVGHRAVGVTWPCTWVRVMRVVNNGVVILCCYIEGKRLLGSWTGFCEIWTGFGEFN